MKDKFTFTQSMNKEELIETYNDKGYILFDENLL